MALLAVALALVLTACTSGARSTVDTESGGGPDDAISEFVSDWQAGRTHDAATLTDDPQAAALLLRTIQTDLNATRLTITPGPYERESDHLARLTATMNWTLPVVGHWEYPVTWTWRLTGTGDDGGWRLEYSPTIVHPELGPQRSLAVRTIEGSPGTIVDRDDVQILSPVRVYSVVVLLDKVRDRQRLATDLADILGQFDEELTAKSLAAELGDAASHDQPSYTVINLRDADFAAVDDELSQFPSLTFPSSTRDLPPTADFGKQVLGEVLPLAEDLIKPAPGWRVVTIDGAGDELSTLAQAPATPGEKVTLTISTRVQQAAEDVLDEIDEPAVLVAIEPSTGGILAVAQNAAANAKGPIAVTGRYPPGSIFKIVTATAAVDGDLIGADTAVGCPGYIMVGKNAIHNEGFALGQVTATKAFAHSCNTTFAKLATELPADALPAAAREYGIGLDFDIPGLTTLTGNIQTADSIAARAQNGFGQGTDLVTPFSAALMAATVAAGQMPTPQLIEGTSTSVDHSAPQRSAEATKVLRTMMRAVVTDGTARSLRDAGTVYAKTGTAEYVDDDGDIQAHAWTVGYRGDIAFSAMIVGGNSSARTNDLLASFLESLPDSP